MVKHYTQQEKLRLLKQIAEIGARKGSKVLAINKSTITRWRKELRILGSEDLIPGKGVQFTKSEK